MSHQLSWKTQWTGLGCLITVLLFCNPLHASGIEPPVQCCANKGDVHYCDSSAGRYVCADGDYSSCYCTRHAVMDLQRLKGCCTWQGGVFKVDEATHVVICNNGGASEICSIYNPVKSVSLW